MLKQPLEQKQINDRKRLILAGRRHVASRARESGKDYAWGAFAVPIEGIVERGRSTLGDRLRDPSRMFIRRRRLWLGSAHGAASENQATVAGIYGAAMSKTAKSTPRSAFSWVESYQAASASLYDQVWMTGWRLTSSIPAMMRSLSSCFDVTRMWRRIERANLEKKPSMRFSHEPCLGVKVNSKRPAGVAASQ